MGCNSKVVTEPRKSQLKNNNRLVRVSNKSYPVVPAVPIAPAPMRAVPGFARVPVAVPGVAGDPGCRFPVRDATVPPGVVAAWRSSRPVTAPVADAAPPVADTAPPVADAAPPGSWGRRCR